MRTVWWSALAAALLAGCDAPTRTRTALSTVPDTATQTGVVAERWRLPRSKSIVAEIFAHAEVVVDDDAIDPRGVANMRTDGFRCAIADLTVVERALAGGGSDGRVGRTWHGEATSWRSLIGRRTQRGTVLLVDGRARRMPESVVSVEIRGWSMPTPEDAAIHLQLVPMVTTSVGSRLGDLPTRPGQLRGRPLSTVLESSLRPGQCLVMASVPRLQVPPRAPESPDSPSPTEEPEAPSSAEREPGIGPGPIGVLPPTIAGWLLEDGTSGSETLIVIHGRPHPGTRAPAPISE